MVTTQEATTQEVTTLDILAESRLKSSKTLTRYYQLGIIPRPVIKTHPSGRGKINYFPRWVLDKVVRIQELKREGISLKRAVKKYERERIENLAAQLDEITLPSKAMEQGSFKFQNGTEVSLLDVFLGRVMSKVREIITDYEKQLSILDKIRTGGIVDVALHMINIGYNPVLLIRDAGEDELRVSLTTDFLLGLHFSHNLKRAKSLLAIDLFSSFWSLFKAMGEEFPLKPTVRPIPQIIIDQEGEETKYNVELGGESSFRLIEEG
ncbi:unnamed protein product, partial [marine sediment metagenome]